MYGREEAKREVVGIAGIGRRRVRRRDDGDGGRKGERVRLQKDTKWGLVTSRLVGGGDVGGGGVGVLLCALPKGCTRAHALAELCRS